jgi:choline dehydrogenase-like flavoprotein
VIELSQLTLGNSTDPYNKAAERGWDITDASKLDDALELEADVVIIGTGAGGGTAAETLSSAGLRVVMLEAGPLKTSSKFDMQERAAYRDLYQEGTGRGTKDGGMVILQGRSVGGSTTVNWTTSFRTPPETLKFWAEHMGVSGCSVEEMAPYFEHMEKRLNIHKWPQDPNENNAMLQRAAEKLGYSWATIHRNVRGCLNLGYCGLGCPVDAKQSMLTTTIPGALGHKAKLVHHARAVRLLRDGDVVKGVEAEALAPNVRGTTGQRITVRASRTVVAGGAMNTPALLLRSEVPDPHGRIGKRTFLHPTTLTMGIYDQAVNPFYGAPQSIYSDHFQWENVDSGPVCFKLEVPPLQPAFAAAFYTAAGEEISSCMDQLNHTQCMIALMRDGFHEDSQGGTVELGDRGQPVIDYPVDAYLLEGVKRAWNVMLEMQFATGAKSARPAHVDGKHHTSWKEAKAAVAALDIVAHKSKVGSAHVMGGCPMGDDPKQSVTDCDGKLHHLDNLYVMDGSLFPTSIGANPQLSIYGLVYKLSSKLAAELTA